MNGWGWTMMIVWPLVWIGVLAVGAWVAVRWARGSAGGKAARDLLDKRLARGDIDLDEYQRRRQALEDRTLTRV